MAYKQGWKTEYVRSYGYTEERFVIYCGNESVSDTLRFAMFDENGEECDITIVVEDDVDDMGEGSLIDCLYALKHLDGSKVKIESMTLEELTRVFD